MLHNIPLNLGTSTATIADALHETLSIPAGGGTNPALKCAYSRAAGHLRGLIVNTSGLEGSGQIVYFMAVGAGETAPICNTVLSSGLPLFPAGSVLELPENANLEYYFAAQGAISIRGIYFAKE